MSLTFSKNIQTFSPELFNNLFALKRYMKGEKELQAIQNLANKPEFLRRPTQTNPYFGRWTILWICLKFPFQAIISSTCFVTAFALNSIWLPHVAAFFETASEQMIRSWHQVTDQWAHKSPLLVPTLNAPKMSAWKVCTCRNIPVHSVNDPDVKRLTRQKAVFREQVSSALDVFYKKLDTIRSKQWFWTRSFRNLRNLLFSKKAIRRSAIHVACEKNPRFAMKQLQSAYPFASIKKPIATLYETILSAKRQVAQFDHIQLYNSPGHCLGGSAWFIYLLLNTSQYFNDPAKHILAVARQFETGISGQGLILQALVDRSGLLHEKTIQMPNHDISTYELDAKRPSALQKIQKLPTGVYRVGTYLHSLVYIKLANGECYTWDPSNGLFEQTPQEFLDHILKHHYKKENPLSRIYFTKHEPKPKST